MACLQHQNRDALGALRSVAEKYQSSDALW